MTALFDQIREFMIGGGIMMWPLVILNFVLWGALCERWLLLYSSSLTNDIRALNQLESEGKLSLSALTLTHKINSGKSLIHTIVTAAPLMGLLGTVMGMIETFESLGDMTLFTQSGGIAGGISQALITTQMGLAVAIPGLLIGRYLFKKEKELESEIDAAKFQTCAANLWGQNEA